MRITKVKNTPDSPLIHIHRTHQHSELTCPPESYLEPETMQELLRQRDASYNHSIVAKTLVRSTSLDENVQRELKSLVESALVGQPYRPHPPFEKSNIPSKEDLKSYLTPMWRGQFSYKLDPNSETKKHIDLPQLLHSSLHHPELASERLAPYLAWVTHFKEKKIKYLARSLNNNRIIKASTGVDTPPLSSRQKALALWAEELTSTHGLKLGKLAKSLDAKTLFENIIKELRANHSKHEDAQRRPAELVKQALRKHFQSLKERNPQESDQLKQYRLEVVKYLEKHYPIKAKKKPQQKKKNNKTKQSTPTLEQIAAEHPQLAASEIEKYVRLRLLNATRQYLLQSGKQLSYGKAHYDSDELMRLRVRESLASQFINACGFAANNLRLAIAPRCEGDILHTRIFRKALHTLVSEQQQAASWPRLRAFFELAPTSPTAALLDEIGERDALPYLQCLAPIRASIQNIRNAVVHFKRDAVSSLFDIDAFEQYETIPIEADGKISAQTSNHPYSDSILPDLLRAELAELGTLYREQLRSTCLLEFYTPQQLQPLLLRRALSTRNVAFAPSFHKVFQYGRQLQQEAGNPYSTQSYFPHDAAQQDACHARKNLLRLIYETLFIPFFLEEVNKREFADAVAEVRSINKEMNQKHAECYAFEQIPEMDIQRETARSYLAQIQYLLTQEEIVKRESASLSATETGHFQRFMYYLFMKGLDRMLMQESGPWHALFATPEPPVRRHQLSHIAPPTSCQARIEEELQQLIIAEREHRIDPSDGFHVSFWCMTKLLSPPFINELSNQILKHKLFEQRLHAARAAQPELENPETARLDVLLDILSLSRLSAEKFYHPDCLTQQRDQLALYVEEENLMHSPYMQSDGETPVLFASVQLAQRYATDSILHHTLSPDDIVTENDIREKSQRGQGIAALMEQRRELHRAICAGERSDDAAREEYITCHEQIDAYDWINNKTTLVHVRQLQQLIMEILGRAASFITLFERNSEFMYEYLRERAPDDYPEKNRKGKLVNGKWSGLLNKVFTPLREKTNLEKYLEDWRNYIAHFNYLGDPKHSLLEIMAHLRERLSHDRKLQNAVVPSLMKILDRHGIMVRFDSTALHQGRLEIRSCLPKEVTHFKKNKQFTCSFDLRSRSYVAMVRRLLEYHRASSS